MCLASVFFKIKFGKTLCYFHLPDAISHYRTFHRNKRGSNIVQENDLKLTAYMFFIIRQCVRSKARICLFFIYSASKYTWIMLILKLFRQILLSLWGFGPSKQFVHIFPNFSTFSIICSLQNAKILLISKVLVI